MSSGDVQFCKGLVMSRNDKQGNGMAELSEVSVVLQGYSTVKSSNVLLWYGRAGYRCVWISGAKVKFCYGQLRHSPVLHCSVKLWHCAVWI